MNPRKTAWYVLWLLLAINMVNYLDRQVLYSLLPLIQDDLKITDAQAGSLASAFMLVYMFAALPIGYWADKGGRKTWIAAGVGLWSCATAASGLARSYVSLFSARSAVGIGESCYGAISPSFVAEHFPANERGSILAIFSMAIPVGSALGYIAGGMMGEHWGWRAAFYWTAVPGVILGLLASQLKDPQETALILPFSQREKAFVFSYLRLFKIPSYSLATLAQAAMTFALGGFAVWIPSFFHRQWLLGVGRAGTLFGGVTVLAGIFGSLAGGWISNWVLKFNSRAYLLVSGIGLLAGMPLAFYTLLSHDLRWALVGLFGAEFFLFLNMGPLNAVIVDVTEVKSRSMAFAANIFVIHALGDAVSPALIGWVSDHFGLQLALLGASVFLGLGGALCFCAMRYYDADAAMATA